MKMQLYFSVEAGAARHLAPRRSNKPTMTYRKRLRAPSAHISQNLPLDGNLIVISTTNTTDAPIGPPKRHALKSLEDEH